jgi:2-polyprenyl-3-methyl-5-hydroxy-6-metoxy-1,4-benzoquinol methylase
MTSLSESAVRPLEWTDELVGRFWDYQSTHRQDEYFTRRFGQRIVEETRRHIPTAAKICDFGCGAGYLTAFLAQRFKIAGYDFSTTSVEATRHRLKGAPNFLGAYVCTDPSPMHGTFDAVYLVETVEHLLVGQEASTMKMVGDMLGPGGSVIVTTPNAEKLDSSMVYCPCCQHEFHRWQHVRSFSKEDLIEFMDKYGFSLREIFSTDFSAVGFWPSLKKHLRQLLGRKNPHLVYIGVKK